MSLLIFALVVLVVVALAVWGVDQLMLGNPVARVVKAVVILIGVIVILNRAGLV